MLCDCGGDLQPRLDFARIEEGLGTLGAVSSVVTRSCVCDAEQCADAVRSLRQSGVKRLVIGGCSREEFDGSLGRGVLEQAGVDDGLWWSVNIRDHCALVHADRQIATGQALERLTSAVNRVGHASAVTTAERSCRTDVVVVGAGVAGLQAAVSLSGLGHSVTVVHRGQTLGGAAAETPELFGYVDDSTTAAAAAVRHQVEELARLVAESDDVSVANATDLKDVSGHLGDMQVTVGTNGSSQRLPAGAVVLATGAATEPATDVVSSARSPRVTDVRGLLAMLRSGSVPGRIAIVMDMVEEQGRAVSGQVLSAAHLAARAGVAVKLFCGSVRVAAPGMEALYRRARGAGVIVCKCPSPPSIKVGGASVSVTSEDTIAETVVSESFDLVVVGDLRQAAASGALPAVVAGLQGGPGGAMQADDVWLLPTSTNLPGVFVVGAARGNSELREALTDGMAVAGEVHAALGDGKLAVCDDAAVVDPDKCVLCLTCVRLCPHGAIAIDGQKGAAAVSDVSCQRCGLCAAECPAQAITLPRYTDAEMSADVGDAPRETVFACKNSAMPASAAAAGREYGSNVQLVMVPCAGKVDARTVLEALEKGAERVLILGCHPESCKSLTGSARAARRVQRIVAMLEAAGVDASRVRFGGISSVEPARFVSYVTAE